MKKLGIILLLATITFFACDKVDELLTFEIEHSTDFTVQASVVPFDPPANMPTPDVTTNAEQKFENNNTSKDKVKDIKLNEVKLDVTDPADKTFSFLKEVYVYISTNSNDEMLVASKTDIPQNAKLVELETTDESLDKYVKSDSYNVRTEVVTREVVSQDVTVEIDMTFQVTADPL